MNTIFEQALAFPYDERKAERKSFLMQEGFGPVAQKAQVRAPSHQAYQALLARFASDKTVTVLPTAAYSGSTEALEATVWSVRQLTGQAFVVDVFETIDAALVAASLGVTALTIPAYGVAGLGLSGLVSRLGEFGIVGIPVIETKEDLAFAQGDLDPLHPVALRLDAAVTPRDVRRRGLVPFALACVSTVEDVNDLAVMGFAGACFAVAGHAPELIAARLEALNDVARQVTPLTCVNNITSPQEIRAAAQSGVRAFGLFVADEDDLLLAKRLFAAAPQHARKVLLVDGHTVKNSRLVAQELGVDSCEFIAPLNTTALLDAPHNLPLVVRVDSVADVEQALAAASDKIVSFKASDTNLLAYLQEHPDAGYRELRAAWGGRGLIVHMRGMAISAEILRRLAPEGIEIERNDWSVWA